MRPLASSTGCRRRADVFLDSLADQQIPGDTLAPRAPAGDAVAVVTAHASKGLEWDVVAVAGVQEGGWPDLRLRGSFLGSERLVDVLGGRDGEDLGAPAATLHATARRSGGCSTSRSTRARRRLLVTAVESEREGSSRRVLDELEPEGVGRRASTTMTASFPMPRALSLSGAGGRAAQRRRRPGDRSASRQAAAGHLADLALAAGRGADPSSWYGLVPLSDDRPVHGPGRSRSRLPVQGGVLPALPAALVPRARRWHRADRPAEPRHPRSRTRR